MEFTLFTLLNGISYGLLLFMLSSGLTLIFSMMGVLNFAHASFYMLGAYIAYTIASRIGFWPALVLAALVGIAGLVLAIEMTYHVTQDAGNGAQKRLFGVLVDTHAAGPWLLAGALVVVAMLGWRLARPGLAQAWDAAGAVMAETIRRNP